jgi:catechol 2,3-dioxygenase-like lactoylglutathione lyase family enzyme
MASTLSASVGSVPQLNAVGVIASDMERSIRFYRLLGLDVPDTPDEAHVDAFLPNGLRFMLDAEQHMGDVKAGWTRQTGNQIALAFECASPAEVDETHRRAVEAGFDNEKEPWDAVWGQRYAQLRDPDGVVVDLYASL